MPFSVDIAFENTSFSSKESESKFNELLSQDVPALEQLGQDYLMTVLDKVNPMYSQSPVLNLIIAKQTGQTSFKVRLEFYFKEEERFYWWVLFNVPHPFEPFPYGKQRTYFPIELGRYVE